MREIEEASADREPSPLYDRELSWLSFNDRVLQEAIDSSVPTCGIVTVEFDAATWDQADVLAGRAIGFDYPKKSDD